MATSFHQATSVDGANSAEGVIIHDLDAERGAQFFCTKKMWLFLPLTGGGGGDLHKDVIESIPAKVGVQARGGGRGKGEVHLHEAADGGVVAAELRVLLPADQRGWGWTPGPVGGEEGGGRGVWPTEPGSGVPPPSGAVSGQHWRRRGSDMPPEGETYIPRVGGPPPVGGVQSTEKGCRWRGGGSTQPHQPPPPNPGRGSSGRLPPTKGVQPLRGPGVWPVSIHSKMGGTCRVGSRVIDVQNRKHGAFFLGRIRTENGCRTEVGIGEQNDN